MKNIQKTFKERKKFFGFGAAALLLVTLAACWFDGDEQSALYTPIKVEMGTIEEVVTAQGKLEPKEYVDVGAQVSGQLEKLHVELGQVVKQGDIIAEIDPEIYESEAKANEARLKTLQAQQLEQQAQVKLASQIKNRNQKLIDAKAVSQEAFEESETSLKVAQAQLQSLNAQIDEAKSTLEGSRAKLNYTKIFAPISGTVVSQTAREGGTLNANQTAPIIVQVANLDIMTVRAQVAEADINKLKEGMPIYFTTLGADKRRWESTVRQILPTPEIINDVVLYNVLVDVENKDRQLMTNMSTQMFFVLGKAENVPVIPVTALIKRAAEADTEAGQAYLVRTQAKADASEQIVHIGLMDRTNAEIKDGLSVGDTLYVSKAGTTPKQAEQRRPGMPRL